MVFEIRQLGVTMGQTIDVNPCCECGSQDNLKTYLDDNNVKRTKCMTPGCDGGKQLSNSNLNPNKPEFLTLEYKDVREISKEVCEKIGIGFSSGLPVFQYKNAQKVRFEINGKKQFKWINHHKNVGLFGESQTFNFDTQLIVTEGEFDAASCVQAGYQAVSIAGGAGGQTKGEIESKLEWLNKFKEIIFWFDNDKVGQTVLHEILTFFPIEKIKVANSPLFKDANEVLQSGGIEAVSLIVDEADFIRPTGLVLGNEVDYNQLLIKEPPGFMVPYPQLNKLLGGIRKGRMYMIGAGTGAGKSSLLKEIVYDWIKNTDLKVANLFLEEKQKETLQSYIALDNNVLLDDLRLNPQMISVENFNKSVSYLRTDRLAFTDAQFNLDGEKLFQVLEYLAKVKKYDMIILDHVSIVVENSDLTGMGERKDIDRLMYRLRTLIHETGITVIAVVHLTEPGDKKAFEEGRRIRMADFRGSRALSQVSDVCISIVRNMQQSKSQIEVLKNRVNSTVGLADELVFMIDTGRLLPTEGLMS